VRGQCLRRLWWLLLPLRLLLWRGLLLLLLVLIAAFLDVPEVNIFGPQPHELFEAHVTPICLVPMVCLHVRYEVVPFRKWGLPNAPVP
jgi:hypothetical protein